MMRNWILILACGSATLWMARVVEGSIERVDFQAAVGGVTQAGYTPVSANAVVLPSGVSVSTTGLFFDRSPGFTNGGAFTFEDLLDDFAYAGPFANVGNAPVTLTIGNLSPLQNYSLRVYSADFFTTNPEFATSITTTYTPIFGTGGPVFSSTFNRTLNPSTNQQYSGAALLTSSALGQISVSIFGAPSSGFSGDAFARLNGFDLESTPEAASLVVWSLLGSIGIAIGFRRLHSVDRAS